MPVPASIQGELISKILLMNKNFSNRKEINLGIIYNKYFRSSVEAKNEIIEKVKSADIGIIIHTIPIEFSGSEDLQEALGSRRCDAIYIAPLRGISLAMIKSFCKENKILTFCGNPDLVSNYFSIGFDLVDDKIKIIINLKEAMDEDADLSSRLLKIARVINKP